jgi:hypothetical protein
MAMTISHQKVRKEQHMRVNFAHISHPSTSGGRINFAVFESISNSGLRDDNSDVLDQLTYAARAQGLRVDQSALAFKQNGRLQFFGSLPLVELLSKNGLPRWTHYLNV